MAFLRRLSQSFTPRPAPLPSLPETTKDNTFLLHLSNPSTFPILDEQTLLTANLAPNLPTALILLKTCHTLQIISPTTGEPLTENINRDIVKALPRLGSQGRHLLVMLLFFWEEEIERWRALGRAEEEHRKILRGYELREGHRAELKSALRALAVQKRTVPSLREEGQSGVEEVEERRERGKSFGERRRTRRFGS